jgi:hypothetical protein
MQDNRSAFLHNEAAKRANEVRERRATVENPQWAMSRPAEWYQNRENLRSVKDTLANVKGNRDFLTTDQNETRNMYQMVMNNMYGGKGARMLDTRGLPEGARRIGRTLFTDPSKSQGFIDNLTSMVLRKPSPAAVRATEWNPLHEEGYGRDWYIDEFGKPWGEKLTGLMKLALPGPLKFMKGKEKEPLPSDRSWIPEGLGEYDEVPYIPFMEDEIVNDDLNIFDIFLENSQIPPQFNIQKLRDEGREGKFNLEDNIPTDVEEVLDNEITNNIDVEIKQKPPFPLTEEEIFNNQYSFVDENQDLTPYEWVDIMIDRFPGMTREKIIENGIFDGVLIEN